MSSKSTVRSEVENRYASAARAQEAALCCPVEYDRKWLEAIPDEVIEKDYGCGDPSKWLKPGETVLDLGSGTGKICFIASQVVGAEGRVIGVDMTDDMLEVARRNAPVVADRTGFSNTEFRKGRIQDLSLDLEAFDAAMRELPADAARDYLAIEDLAADLRTKQPLVTDDSIDVVVSNCVLNLVEAEEKPRLFRELFRVLKNGGRAVISDIVADESVPQHLMDDPTLWSGCISGALTEQGFLKAFEEAGFHGVELVKFESEPWQTVEGIEFRSVTVQAWKGKIGPCYEKGQAVIYLGPYRQVCDDDGHRYPRGERMAVCDKTFRLLQNGPYAKDFAFLHPAAPERFEGEQPFRCQADARRHPSDTKAGADTPARVEVSECRDGQCC
ncbi:MAG TPA: methyltransferase domain-containing protein [Opitutales bacterium]|nr:methyltransferase domain-containing protein [Opitutales bacterium]